MSELECNLDCFQTPCCRKTYQCRFCHDSSENHVLQRDDVTKVVCANCGHKQGVEQTCQNCGTIFGRVSEQQELF